ncbi:hypothetical protein MBANPS3_005818 [Mucor bainieri]
MVFASVVSLISSVVKEVCFSTTLPTPKPVQTPFLPPRIKAYDVVEDSYCPKFQLAEENDYCIIEELDKMPVKVEYKSNKAFSSAKEAEASMVHDLLEARWCPMPHTAASQPTRQEASINLNEKNGAFK